MGVKVKFQCDGCEVSAKAGIQQHFESFSGMGHGFGVYKVDTVESVCPDGWCAFDLIGCTYCPACTVEIFGEKSAEATA